MSNSKKKKTIVIMLVLGLSIFGYSQYASASQINVIITQSKILEENDKGTTYNIELEFTNPSLLMLTAGQTEFEISTEDQKLGQGTLEPFVLSAISKTIVEGTFLSEDSGLSDDQQTTQQVKISGVTTYDVLFTSIDVPFVYYPSKDQAREFIHQG